MSVALRSSRFQLCGTTNQIVLVQEDTIVDSSNINSTFPEKGNILKAQSPPCDCEIRFNQISNMSALVPVESWTPEVLELQL